MNAHASAPSLKLRLFGGALGIVMMVGGILALQSGWISSIICGALFTGLGVAVAFSAIHGAETA